MQRSNKVSGLRRVIAILFFVTNTGYTRIWPSTPLQGQISDLNKVIAPNMSNLIQKEKQIVSRRALQVVRQTILNKTIINKLTKHIEYKHTSYRLYCKKYCVLQSCHRAKSSML